MIGKLSSVSNESMLGKFFDPNDIGQLKFLKENFPEQYDLARRAKLQSIYENSIDHSQGRQGKFDTGKYLRQLNDTKLNPEARDMLFDGVNQQKFRDIENVYQSIPGNPNPSGTSYANSFSHLFGLQGIAENLSDAARYALLKASPHLEYAINAAGGGPEGKIAASMIARNPMPGSAGALYDLQRYVGAAIKGDNLAGRAVKSVFDGSASLPSTIINATQKDRDKLDKKVRTASADFGQLQNTSGDLGTFLPDHAQSIAQTVGTAVQYLSSLRPNEDKGQPLDSTPKVSSVAQAKYNNALDIAGQPLSILPKIKNGTITADDLTTLKTVFPSMYQGLTQKIYDKMNEHLTSEKTIPYQTRLGLSLFLGHPLDSTMTPGAIQTLQGAQGPTANQAANAQAKPQGPHSMKDIGKLAQGAVTPEQALEGAQARSRT